MDAFNSLRVPVLLKPRELAVFASPYLRLYIHTLYPFPFFNNLETILVAVRFPALFASTSSQCAFLSREYQF